MLKAARINEQSDQRHLKNSSLISEWADLFDIAAFWAKKQKFVIQHGESLINYQVWISNILSVLEIVLIRLG